MRTDRTAAPAPTAPAPHLATILAAWRGDANDRRAVADVVIAVAETGARLAGVIATSAVETGRVGAGRVDGGRAGSSATPVTNASGDEQKPLDLVAEAMFVDALAGCDVAAICSEETAHPIGIAVGGSLVVTLDPVDGSSNIDINAPIGTIFSVLPATGFAGDPDAAALQPGRNQVAAGLIVYGPRTVLVLTLGDGTDVFFLNPATGVFVLAHRGIVLPIDAQEYAVNASNARHWGPGVRSYVDDLVSGSVGPRGRDFNMRWFAALVADAYRILVRGGIFLYPADERPAYREGRIRLVYEANPVAFLCEQAGGLATDGVNRVLDIEPASLHQRTPFVFGSRGKVERVRRYLLDPATTHERSPLFARRGLFRD